MLALMMSPINPIPLTLCSLMEIHLKKTLKQEKPKKPRNLSALKLQLRVATVSPRLVQPVLRGNLRSIFCGRKPDIKAFKYKIQSRMQSIRKRTSCQNLVPIWLPHWPAWEKDNDEGDYDENCTRS